MTTLLVLAKSPVAGQVKTRLTPPITPDQAASLAEACLHDTLTAIVAAPAERHVLLLNGNVGPWLPPGIEVIPSLSGIPAERSAAVTYEMCPGPVLAMGMDTPQITPDILAPALGPDAWTDCDAWINPATDGEFWSLGLAHPDPRVLGDVPLSTASTVSMQYERLTSANLTVRTLPELRDIDTAPSPSDIRTARPDPPSRGKCARPLGQEEPPDSSPSGPLLPRPAMSPSGTAGRTALSHSVVTERTALGGGCGGGGGRSLLHPCICRAIRFNALGRAVCQRCALADRVRGAVAPTDFIAH